MDFNNIDLQRRKILNQQIGRRDILPTSIEGRALAQDILGNSSVSTGTFSFNDGVITTLTVRTTSNQNSNIRLGTLPFMVAFYNTNVISGINPGTNQIPFDTTTGDFLMYGPAAMPNFNVSGKRYTTSTGTYFASDGNDTVYKVALENQSGSPENVFYLIQTRIIQSRGTGTS